MAEIRKFTIADTRTWEQVTGKQIFGGDLIDESSGYRMSAMYWRLQKGEAAEVPIPSDEVWIVGSGAVTIRTTWRCDDGTDEDHPCEVAGPAPRLTGWPVREWMCDTHGVPGCYVHHLGRDEMPRLAAVVA